MKKITLLFLLLTASFSFSQVVLTEDFEAGLTIPTGWSVQDLSVPPNGEVWTIETGGEAGGFNSPNTLVYTNGGEGNYATFDSDGYGDTGTAEESTLTSPIFDCSALGSVTLSFTTFYNGNYGGLGEIEVYNGTTWVNIHTYPTQPGGSPSTTVGGIQTFDVPELVGVSNAQIRFRWTGNWSISWSIDNISVYECTVAAPAAASAITPANGATGVDINFGDTADSLGPIEWSDVLGADSYNISFGTDTAGSNIGGLSGVESGITINYTWADNTTYYWFVEAVNCAGTTASSVFSFTTQSCTATVAPSPASTPVPANGATAVAIDASNNNGLALSWTGAGPNDDFSLVFGTANPPTQTFNNFENGETITGLEEFTTYYWRIVSGNCVGTTDGPVWSFTTGQALSVNENQLTPFSVFPNPTTDVLNIKGTRVIERINVFNLLGQNVATFNGNEIVRNSINLSTLPNGLYLIKITSGENTQTVRVTKE